MKITIDLEDPAYFEWKLYNSKAEWDADPHSAHYRDTQWKEGTYQTTARDEPFEFPCIGIFNGTLYNPNSYDEENICWIYGFTVTEE